MKKRPLALGLSLALCASLIPSALAAEISFHDVPAGSWFEKGGVTCAERGVMVGTGDKDIERDYELHLIRRDGAPVNQRLLLPSTVVWGGYYNPTDRAPDSMGFSEDGKTFTYVYAFDTVLMDGEEMLHDAGVYRYTVDMATGELSVTYTANEMNMEGRPAKGFRRTALFLLERCFWPSGRGHSPAVGGRLSLGSYAA
ncbi:MAG: hypothetical protein HFF05_06390 [Oscillospiraceae bacterium]|nr:hypothetical protein [Oscillospiraceae bacterium]